MTGMHEMDMSSYKFRFIGFLFGKLHKTFEYIAIEDVIHGTCFRLNSIFSFNLLGLDDKSVFFFGLA